MQIEEKFNRRHDAPLLAVGLPAIHGGSPYPLGVQLTFREPGAFDKSRWLHLHMTPDEALAHAAELIKAASAALREQHGALTAQLERAQRAS
jgi:hypothetical protein